MQLSESQKILLAKLRLRNPERYREKLEALGAQESDITEYYVKELERDAELKKINRPVNKKKETLSGYTYYMGGSPYWSPTPRPISKSNYNNTYGFYNLNYTYQSDRDHSKRTFVLVDGDNNPFHNMVGYEKVKNSFDIDVVVYVANESLADEYRRKYDVKTICIPSGNQAVDNQIKTVAGNKLKGGNYDRIIIISCDQGYREKIRDWKSKYSLGSQDIILSKNFKCL